MIRYSLALSLVTVSLGGFEPETLAPGTQLLGPTPYRSVADSPIANLGLAGFLIETFEDHTFNVPGVSANHGFVTSIEYSGSLIDSVDGDDGNPGNGTCVGCDSFFFGDSFLGVTFTFDPNAPGGLPTHAGIVWTDGGFGAFTTFQAFDRQGASLGVIGPVAIADLTNDESTGEDRFFGVINPDGIASFTITNSQGGIELDHLQYGHELVCIDLDEDGFGQPGDANCPGGSQTDCDDQDPRVSPGEVEVYDAKDNNCDGSVDEGLDSDGDGVPNFYDACNGTPPGSSVSPDGCPSCTQVSDADSDGYPAPADCDDGDAGVYPGAPELCNLTDDDCDGLVDEGFDADGDGFTTCAAPLADCVDTDSAIKPGAIELPGNTVDENCDGSLGACDPGAVWRNHGEFVRCVATECGQHVNSGLLSNTKCDHLVSQAAQSDVGK